MIKKSGRGISIPNYNICITHPSQYFILSSFSDLNIIQSMLKANFKIVDNQFYVEWDDLILNVKCKQELFTMKEVFVFQEYNYIIEKPSVLIDIGFNVGYTSLFFAKNEMVKKVYAFEPFDETLEQGKLNLSLNPMLKEKVILYNYGLSGKDEERCIWYNFNVKGGIGKLGNDVSKISDSIKKRIILKRFDEVYSEIAKKEIGNEIILKIDCEGDEYEIVKSFHNIQQELLPGVLLIEWHSLGDEEIIKHIRSFGYHIFSFHVENKRRGNLYCLKK
ncbi:MAG: FkbM family methyltransferase [Acidobacterium ailaaui]|nr:FkbM family methyltransferase [Pseudacidobacterium ailaaui]